MKAKEKKLRKPPLGSAQADPTTAVLIRELLKLRKQRALLNAKAKLISARLLREHLEGAAHGHRLYIAHVAASVRTVRVKAHDRVVLVKLTPKETT